MAKKPEDIKSEPWNLSQEITAFITERIEAVIARFLPELRLPKFFCGLRLTSSSCPDLIFVLCHLYRLGVRSVAGFPMEQAICKLLRQVDGPRTETFFSYRVAEALLAFGDFEHNPLLEELTVAERENLRVAVDSTHIFDQETQTLGKWANNYWGVLARCEFGRQRLGILEDTRLFEKCLSEFRNILFRNPLGYFDDDGEGRGRYDIYSADVLLFCEPLWHLLAPEKVEFNLREHVRLLEKIAMENGASYVYGRSIGAHSICLTMELAAISLEQGLAADPARTLGLIRHGFKAFKSWFAEDLINAHRAGQTDGYRRFHRLLEMTTDCLGKACYVAEKLQQAQPIPELENTVLFPALDEFVPFDREHTGLWMFRNRHLSFQLPVMDGYNSDYNPWPRSPGLLENPVDSRIYCGVPRVAIGSNEYTVVGRASKIEKRPNALVLIYDQLRCVEGDGTPLAGQFRFAWQVDGDTLHCDSNLSFEWVPEGISLFVPETDRPLVVGVGSSVPFHKDTVAVSGITEWRSCWGEAKNVHQIHLTPSRQLQYSLSIAPKLRVLSVPADDHDYTRALFKAMPKGRIDLRARPGNTGMEAPLLTANIDILHIGWPEAIFWPSPDADLEQFDLQYLEFIEALGKSRIRIVWTMHNRRPHCWESERGRRLYRAWAAVADGVIHHSNWGMDLVRRELPFRKEAQHVIIPHGHYGEQMRVKRSREQSEALLNLPVCSMRFGVLGRWQKEKQVELIIEAFQAAARPDQQLVISAYTPETPRPDDPRIIFLPRREWMRREEIAEHVHLCDALVSAHLFTHDSYLTSGIYSDAVGAGIGMLVPQWEFFHEMLGDAALYHDNTQESLTALFASLTPGQLQRSKAGCCALQPRFAWPVLAEKTLALYSRLGRK